MSVPLRPHSPFIFFCRRHCFASIGMASWLEIAIPTLSLSNLCRCPLSLCSSFGEIFEGIFQMSISPSVHQMSTSCVVLESIKYSITSSFDRSSRRLRAWIDGQRMHSIAMWTGKPVLSVHCGSYKYREHCCWCRHPFGDHCHHWVVHFCSHRLLSSISTSWCWIPFELIFWSNQL